MNKESILNWFKNVEHNGFEYNNLLLNYDMEIWTQNLDENIIIELHFKKNTEKQFGSYYINLTDIYNYEELTDKVYKYQNDFADLGFDRFVEKYKNIIIGLD